MKYGGRCEYLGAAPTYSGTSLGKSQLPSPPEHGVTSAIAPPAVLDAKSSRVFTEAIDVEITDISPVQLRHLELMHYYTAFTSLSISDMAAFKPIWQEAVPKEAQSHPFLMHGMLALAALHIAHDRPQAKDIYTAVALKHYNVALVSFRTSLKQVTEENCTALFGFSALLIILSLAFAQSHPSTQDMSAIEELIQTFTLLRGVRVVLQSAMQWVAQGPLGALLNRSVTLQYALPKHSVRLPPDFIEALDRLDGYNERRSETADRHKVYSVAINAIRVCLKKIEDNPCDNAAALNWLVFLESSYVSALKTNQPLALVILAHYGVVLHGLLEHWFVQDWGVRLIEVVYMNLGEEWKSLVHWPMEQVELRGQPEEADKSNKAE